MVDEVQDCNARDWEIYETLSALHGNLFLVGDPDQTIYEWRGAYLEKFLQCKPQTDIIMAQNYRSTSTILDAANSIIEHNDMRIPKDLFTQNNIGDVITHFHGKDDRQEADWISKQINSMQERGAEYSDFAVLVRSAYLTRAIEQSFMRNKISYVIWGGVRFFERKEIKDSLSYLRLIAFDDDMAFKRIVNVPSRKIGNKSIKVIMDTAQEQGCSMFEALRTLSTTKAFAKEPVRKFIELIESARTLSQGMSISNLMEYVLANSGLNELYRNDEEEERLENLNELVQSIKTYESDHKEDEVSLESYLQDVALYTNVDNDRSKNHVKVMTIHQSKGLEFPYVFISGLSDGIMPNKRSVRERKKKAMEEERRLMYVAVTRAEKRLFLTESEGYSAQGGFNKVPSRFLREIKEHLMVTEGQLDEDLWNRAAIFSRSMDMECGMVFLTETCGFVEGDEVIHDHFGYGIIRNIYDSGEYCEVEFLDAGLRSLKTEKLKKA
jgi:DNA helicase-2/ATP-dependent DNA helicase PcrA